MIQNQQANRVIVQALTRVDNKWEFARLLNGALERTGVAERLDDAVYGTTGAGEEISALTKAVPANGTRILVTVEIIPPAHLTANKG